MRRPAAPESLSSPEDHVGYWLRFISNHASHAFSRNLLTLGVTVAEWMVLRTLYGSALDSPSVLAETMGLSRGAISRLVDRLVRKKLVTRTVSADDRRCQTIALTAAGVHLVPKMTRLAEQNERTFFSLMSEKERVRLIGRMRAISRKHGLKQIPME